MAVKNRTFRVKYGDWPTRDAKVPTGVLEGLNGDGLVRVVMIEAFKEHKDRFKAETWTDDVALDRKVVLVKATDGLYEGKREHPKSDKTPQEWYIMETTAQ